MNFPQQLVALDFDHSLIESNSDVRIESLAKDYICTEEKENLRNIRNSGSWTRYMGEIFKLLYKNKVTESEYTKCLSELGLIPGMKELLIEMHESGKYEVIVISDANTFFIEYVLKAHGLDGVIKEIFTNPAEFDNSGCLQIQELDNQNTCPRCPSNLCKGCILEKYVQNRKHEHVTFQKIMYIGDGGGDVCPSLRLKAEDNIFARNGYHLLKSLKKLKAQVKATVHAWDTGYDIRNMYTS